MDEEVSVVETSVVVDEVPFVAVVDVFGAAVAAVDGIQSCWSCCLEIHDFESCFDVVVVVVVACCKD